MREYILAAACISTLVFAAFFGSYAGTHFQLNSGGLQQGNGLLLHAANNPEGKTPKADSYNTFWSKVDDDPISYFTEWLTVFTGFLFLSSAIQIGFLVRADRTSRIASEAAKKSADIASKTLAASNRPWIKVNTNINGPLTYEKFAPYLSFEFVLENVGKSPAKSAYIYFEVRCQTLSDDKPFYPLRRIRELVESARKQSEYPFGFTVFEGTPISQKIGTYVVDIDVAKCIETDSYINPVLMGTVVYKSEFDDVPHVTGFVFDIMRNPVPRPLTIAKNRFPGAIFPDEGDVPRADLRLHQNAFNGSYAD
ncbi:hypothetical protein [Methylocystis heyeri]|uniref:Uncharacterized protein n=1 Tax=Methylocystis heyeri TaxID=391905 RepID=A0A6B8KHA0_9HYPH|nr:hypothetical protein [Methylocystis heyeri]QGM46979.1 hypothetical protein H2LOC_015490 [Methylocystis heyeri]